MTRSSTYIRTYTNILRVRVFYTDLPTLYNMYKRKEFEAKPLVRPSHLDARTLLSGTPLSPDITVELLRRLCGFARTHIL